jgi:hypothetical protein
MGLVPAYFKWPFKAQEFTAALGSTHFGSMGIYIQNIRELKYKTTVVHISLPAQESLFEFEQLN